MITCSTFTLNLAPSWWSLYTWFKSKSRLELPTRLASKHNFVILIFVIFNFITFDLLHIFALEVYYTQDRSKNGPSKCKMYPKKTNFEDFVLHPQLLSYFDSILIWSIYHHSVVAIEYLNLIVVVPGGHEYVMINSRKVKSWAFVSIFGPA